MLVYTAIIRQFFLTRPSWAEEAAVNRGTYRHDPPKAEDWYIFAEVFDRRTITRMGVGITILFSLVVLVAGNGFDLQGFRPYFSFGFGGAFVQSSYRAGVSTGV